MTLRTMAKILGISPAYLSLLVNGKRPWRGNLKERYEVLVNTPKGNTSLTKASEDDSVPSARRWWSWGDSNPLPLQCH